MYSGTEVKKLQQMTSAWTACFYIQVKFSTWISGHKICILFNSSLFCHHYIVSSAPIMRDHFSLRHMKLIFDGLDLLFCWFWSFIWHQISFLMIKFEFFSHEKIRVTNVMCLLKLRPKYSMLTITFRFNLNKDPKGLHGQCSHLGFLISSN